MTACCQITCAIPWLPCEQLPYPPEHPRISRIRRRDKSDLPLPSLSYKYFLQVLFFYLVTLQPQTHLPGSGTVSRTWRTLARISSNNLPSPRSYLLSGRNGHQLHRPWGQLDIPLFLIVLLFLCKSIHWVRFSSSLFLSCSFNRQTFRSWLIKLLFPPINPTSNALVRWETQILPIW